MGWNDYLGDSELSNLPEEAHDNRFDLTGPFEPSDHWLSRASKDDQEIAVREWFLARYCDPAGDTPYNGREGGYLFIHGGPYDPANEIPNRFTGLVPDSVIEQIIDEMHEMHGDQWAPVNNERPDDYYDSLYDLEQMAERSQPLTNLKARINQYQQLLALQVSEEAKTLCRSLLYSATVGALESFLWETVYFWVDNDIKSLHDIIVRIQGLRDKQIKLGDIVKENKSPKDHVKAYLQGIVWHQTKRVKPLFEQGLGITLPDIAFFEKALQKRHHIVHRSGHDMDKKPINVQGSELDALFSQVSKFASAIDKELESRSIRSN